MMHKKPKKSGDQKSFERVFDGHIPGDGRDESDLGNATPDAQSILTTPRVGTPDPEDDENHE